MEFDERNSYLMTVGVTYNRREADKNLGYNYRELKDKIQNELDSGKVIIARVLGHGTPSLMLRRNATVAVTAKSQPPVRFSRV